MSIQWGTVADWVSGVGSLAAAFVALYLAKDQKRIQLKGYFGARVLVGGGTPPTDLITISVTNVGHRATVINNVGLRVGRFKKMRHAIIQTDRMYGSAPIPLPLADGQQGQWNIPLVFDGRNWIDDLCDLVETEADIKSLRAVVFTTHQEPAYLPAEEGLRKMIREAQKRRAAKELVNQ